MKITAITKFKHGELWLALQKLGKTQSDLARGIGTNATLIGGLINLRRPPTEAMANRIQNYFAEHGVYVDVTAWWPESFTGLAMTPVVEQTQDIDPALVCQLCDNQPLVEQISAGQDVENLNRALSLLPNRERMALELTMIDGFTAKEAGKRFNVTGGRITQLAAKGMRKLRSLMAGEQRQELSDEVVRVNRLGILTDNQALAEFIVKRLNQKKQPTNAQTR